MTPPHDASSANRRLRALTAIRTTARWQPQHPRPPRPPDDDPTGGAIIWLGIAVVLAWIAAIWWITGG